MIRATNGEEPDGGGGEPGVAVPVTKPKAKTRLAPRYKVFIHNDDVTPMDDVMADAAGSEAAPNPMDCPFMTAHHEREGDSEDGRHCPFGPALGQDCAVAPSLPGLTLDVRAAPAQAASRTSLDEVQPHLLLARALFHPPRV